MERCSGTQFNMYIFVNMCMKSRYTKLINSIWTFEVSLCNKLDVCSVFISCFMRKLSIMYSFNPFSCFMLLFCTYVPVFYCACVNAHNSVQPNVICVLLYAFMCVCVCLPVCMCVHKHAMVCMCL